MIRVTIDATRSGAKIVLHASDAARIRELAESLESLSPALSETCFGRCARESAEWLRELLGVGGHAAANRESRKDRQLPVGDRV